MRGPDDLADEEDDEKDNDSDRNGDDDDGTRLVTPAICHQPEHEMERLRPEKFRQLGETSW
jgi:hypothetical protein